MTSTLDHGDKDNSLFDDDDVQIASETQTDLEPHGPVQRTASCNWEQLVKDVVKK